MYMRIISNFFKVAEWPPLEKKLCTRLTVCLVFMSICEISNFPFCVSSEVRFHWMHFYTVFEEGATYPIVSEAMFYFPPDHFSHWCCRVLQGTK